MFKPSRQRRRGTALIEFAICMPVFFAITMGTIETCRMIYLRQSLMIAAYECARLGIVPEVTSDSVQDQCDVILLGRGIKKYELECSPQDPSTLQYGEIFKTTISTPAEENALVGGWFYRGKVISASVSIMAEY